MSVFSPERVVGFTMPASILTAFGLAVLSHHIESPDFFHDRSEACEALAMGALAISAISANVSFMDKIKPNTRSLIAGTLAGILATASINTPYISERLGPTYTSSTPNYNHPAFQR